MINKKILKILLSFLITLSLTAVFAVSYATNDLTGIKEKIKPKETPPGLVNPANDIIGIAQVIGVAILIAGIIIAGITMVMSAGDPKKKADAKTALIGMSVGIVLVFMPLEIVKILMQFGDSVQEIEAPVFESLMIFKNMLF